MIGREAHGVCRHAEEMGRKDQGTYAMRAGTGLPVPVATACQENSVLSNTRCCLLSVAHGVHSWAVSSAVVLAVMAGRRAAAASPAALRKALLLFCVLPCCCFHVVSGPALTQGTSGVGNQWAQEKLSEVDVWPGDGV